MILRQLGTLLAGLILAGLPLSARGGPEDMLLLDGTIWTGDPNRPWAESVWIEDGRIKAVGGTEELDSAAPAGVSRRRLQGAFVSPGLIDAHAHLLSFGLQLDRVDLVGAESLEETLSRIAAKVQEARIAEREDWIVGRGWDQNDWPVQEFPTRQDLDAICPDIPISLDRIDGHAIWVNTKALEMAGVDAGTQSPEGGMIHRDAQGFPTGVLIDNAEALVTGMIPEPSLLAKQTAIRKALEEMVKVGLTGMHDMGMDADDLKAYRELSSTQSALPRIYASYSVTDPQLETVLREGPDTAWNGSWFKLGMVKFYLDGALGSRGAALLEEYSDDPHNRGLITMDEETYRKNLRAVVGAGFQAAVHAIGDRGNRMALDVWEEVRQDAVPVRKTAPAFDSFLGAVPAALPQMRIEHAQIVHPQDIPRFQELRVVASMQPTHCTSDMPWAPSRLGEDRLQGAYAWRRFAQHHVLLASGSDFPVESHDPRLGLYAAVTRHSLLTDQAWSPEERLGRQEALVSFTAAPAYVSGDLDQLGTLSVGKLADLVVWDQNLITCDPSRIPQARSLLTLIGGEVVWQDAEGGRP